MRTGDRADNVGAEPVGRCCRAQPRTPGKAQGIGAACPPPRRGVDQRGRVLPAARVMKSSTPSPSAIRSSVSKVTLFAALDLGVVHRVHPDGLGEGGAGDAERPARAPYVFP